jgi:hypothetical protein
MDRNPMDHCLMAHDIHSGRTDLHFVNDYSRNSPDFIPR